MNQFINNWIRPEIQQLTAYHVPDSGDVIKLNAMENPYQWDSTVIEEWLNILRSATLNRYPDSAAREIKQQLRTVMQVPDSMEIILGNGSDELIQMLILALNAAQRLLLVPEPSFVMYHHLAQVAGMRYIGVPLQADDFTLDMFAMLEAIEIHRPALIFLACPNNPTGNVFAVDDIEAIIETTQGIVVVDEAYAPFVETTFMPRLEEYPNLLVMRTVSKLGLAGLRLGMLAGSREWIEQLEKVRQPYNTNTLTQLTATFALQHYDMFAEQTKRIKAERTNLLEQLNSLKGIHVWHSEANFILFRIANAQNIFDKLLEQGILIKCVHGRHPLLDNCLQVTVGTLEENQAFLKALTKIV